MWVLLWEVKVGKGGRMFLFTYDSILRTTNDILFSKLLVTLKMETLKMIEYFVVLEVAFCSPGPCSHHLKTLGTHPQKRQNTRSES